MPKNSVQSETPFSWRGIAGVMLGAGILYALSARFGLLFVIHPEGIAGFWPSAGVFVALLLLISSRYQIPVILAVSIANIAANVFEGNSVPVSIGFGLANCAEAWITAYLLRRHVQPGQIFESVRNSLFFLMSAGIGSAAGAVCGGAVTSLLAGARFADVWLVWFSADLLGILIFGSGFIVIVTDVRRRKFRFSPGTFLEYAVTCLAAAVMLYVLFFQHSFFNTGPAFRPYLLIPLLAFAGFRFGKGGSAALSIVLSLIIMGRIARELNVDADLVYSPAARLFGLQLYLLVAHSFTLLFAVLLDSRNRSIALLKSSEEYFRALIEKSTDGVVIIDAQGRITYASQNILALSGYDPAEVVSLDIMEFVHGDDRTETGKILRHVLTTPGMSETAVFRVVRKNGEIWWMEATARNLVADPAVRGVIINFRDVSEQRLLLERIRESEEQFRQLVERSSEMFYRQDAITGRFIYISPRVTDLFGYTVEEFLAISGEDRIEKIHPEDQAVIRRFLPDLIAADERGERFMERRFRVRRKNGAYCWVHGNYTLLRAPNGTPFQVVGSLHDITVRMQAEMELQAVREHLEYLTNEQLIILDNASIGIAKVIERRLVWVNSKMEEIFGYTRRALVDQSTRILYADDETFESVGHDATPVLLQGKTFTTERILLRRDGSQMEVRFTGKALNPAEPAKGSIWIFEDITEQRQKAQALRESEERFSKTFYTSPIGMVISSAYEGRVIDVNDAFCRMSGYSREEMVGETTVALRIYAEPAERDECLMLLRSEGRVSTRELTLRTKAGDRRLVSVSMEKIVLFGAPCISTFAIDVTEQRKKEQELRESEERFSKAFHVSPAAMVISGEEDGIIIDVNETYCRLSGFDRDELIGSSGTERMLWADSSERSVCMDLVREEGRVVGRHVLFRRKDGKYRWASISIEPMTLRGRRCVAMFALDITEELEEERERAARIDLLQIVNEHAGKTDLIHRITSYLKQWLGCDAVGIRLREGDDFPYFETQGFPEHFIAAERYLCARDAKGDIFRDAAGNPVLECMCGNILCGRFNPRMSFFTEHGSFWSNHTTKLLASTTEDDRESRTRNRCNSEGYESVGLFPLRYGKDIFGLIQVNDRKVGLFTPRLIIALESLGDTLAIALNQHRTTEILAASEEKFRQLAENIREVFWIRDMVAGGITYVSPAYELIFGRSCQSLYDRPASFLEAVVPEDLSRVRGAYVRMRSGVPFDEEYRILRPDGTQRWIHARTFPVQTEHGTVKRYVGIAEDITERKQAELDRERSEKRFRALIEKSTEAISLLNAQGGFFYDSPSASVLTGYAPEELAGMDRNIMIHPDDWQELDNSFTSLIGRPGAFDGIQFRIRRKDGAVRWIEAIGTNLLHVPEIEALVLNYRDITDRRTAEEALRTSEQNMRTILDTMTEGVALNEMIFNEAGEMIDYRILDVNSHFHAIADVATHDVIGRCATELYGMSREYITAFWRSHRERTATVFTEMVSPLSGRVFYISTSPFRENKFLTVFLDITELKKTQAALVESESRYRLLHETAGVGIGYYSVDGVILSLNQIALQLLNSTAEELIGKSLYTVFPRERADEYVNRIKRTAQSEAVLEHEDCVPTLTGSQWILTVYARVVDRTGKVVGVQVIAKDITARKEAELALRESEEELNVLYSNAPYLMVLVDKDRVIRKANQAAGDFAGRPVAGVAGRRAGEVLNCLHALDDPRGCGFGPSCQVCLIRRSVMDTLETGVDRNNVEGEFDFNRGRGHERIIYSLSTTRLVIRGEAQVLVTVQDITERREAQEAVRVSRDQLRVLAEHLENVREEERTSIAREIHDELGQQLTGLKMNVAWLDRHLKGNESLLDKTKYMRTLIDGAVQSVRRIAANLRPGVLDELGLIPAIEWQASEFKKVSGVSCILKKSDVPFHLPSRIKTAAFRIFQEALTNIARHAEASSVVITVDADVLTLTLRIEDDGVGIDRMAISDPRSIGLLGMRERAVSLGGRVDIRPREPRGTIVEAVLPIEDV